MAIQRFNARRQLEWQLAFAVWATLVALTAFLGRLQPTCSLRWLSVTLAVLLAALHGGFEYRYFTRSRTDWREGITLARWIREHGDLSPELRDHLPEVPSNDQYSPFFSHWWHVTITCLLCGLLPLTVFLAG
jgi:hypothetical protein